MVISYFWNNLNAVSCFIVQEIIYLALIVFLGIILLCIGELCPFYYLFRKTVWFVTTYSVEVYFAARNKEDMIEGILLDNL